MVDLTSPDPRSIRTGRHYLGCCYTAKRPQSLRSTIEIKSGYQSPRFPPLEVQREGSDLITIVSFVPSGWLGRLEPDPGRKEMCRAPRDFRPFEHQIMDGAVRRGVVGLLSHISGPRKVLYCRKNKRLGPKPPTAYPMSKLGLRQIQNCLRPFLKWLQNFQAYSLAPRGFRCRAQLVSNCSMKFLWPNRRR